MNPGDEGMATPRLTNEVAKTASTGESSILSERATSHAATDHVPQASRLSAPIAGMSRRRSDPATPRTSPEAW